MDGMKKKLRIRVVDYATTCYACPTIFDMTTTGRPGYFRLRDGSFRLAYDDGDRAVIVSGPAPDDLDGVCTFEDALGLVRAAGVDITYEPARQGG